MQMMSYFNSFFPQQVRSYFSDRQIDFSFSSDEKEVLSSSQRVFLQKEWSLDPERCVNIRQVHGNRILKVDEPFSILPQADGLITNQKNLTLLIRTADCLPVFFYDPLNEAVGLVHAGWRGSRDAIVVETVSAMTEYFGTQPQDIKVAFGPAISPAFYEVGREFLEYFSSGVDVWGLKCTLDLALVNRDQLESVGVRSENIHDCGICTYANERFFSYRREGATSGRMVSVIAVRSL